MRKRRDEEDGKENNIRNLKKLVTGDNRCNSLCNPIDYTVHGILQAKILAWVAIPFYRGSSQPWDWTHVSHIAGGFFTSWVTGEAHFLLNSVLNSTLSFSNPLSTTSALHSTYHHSTPCMCAYMHTHLHTYTHVCFLSLTVINTLIIGTFF